MFVVHFAEYASGGVATYIRLLINNQANDSEIKKIVLVISDKNSEDFYFDSEKVVVERYKYSRGFVGLFVLVMQLLMGWVPIVFNPLHYLRFNNSVNWLIIVLN